MTKQEIKEELKEVKFYYFMKSTFERNSRVIPPKRIEKIIERYNQIMQNKAPPELLCVYEEIYINGVKQSDLALYLGLSLQAIKYYHARLVDFLYKNLEKEEKL